MDKPSFPVTQLTLCTPIFYEKIDKLPSPIPKHTEFLLCFDINPTQSRSIEPVRSQFLDNLIFTAQKTPDNLQQEVSLPQGKYIFLQSRGTSPLEQDEWLDIAIEQQKDSLWERHKLSNILYVRYLHEDDMFVTQVFRVMEG